MRLEPPRDTGDLGKDGSFDSGVQHLCLSAEAEEQMAQTLEVGRQTGRPHVTRQGLQMGKDDRTEEAGAYPEDLANEILGRCPKAYHP